MTARAMRDAVIGAICDEMATDERIMFCVADLGAPALDGLRQRFPDRFINVGIAEQNLINVSAGLAFEGHTVYAYAIAPFLCMRALEQIRVNLSMLSQLAPMNVNLLGLGAGFSYDLSGPSHHSPEDLSIMKVLPGFKVFSFCDAASAEAFAHFSARSGGLKYARLEGKPVEDLYRDGARDGLRLEDGFAELRRGEGVCFVATGIMTQKVMATTGALPDPPGVVDLFELKAPDHQKLASVLRRYESAITVEEAFVGKGGLDATVAHVLQLHQLKTRLVPLGIRDRYNFEIGGREMLHGLNGVGRDDLVGWAQKLGANRDSRGA